MIIAALETLEMTDGSPGGRCRRRRSPFRAIDRKRVDGRCTRLDPTKVMPRGGLKRRQHDEQDAEAQ
jgi:hypothetical protein